MKQRLWIVLCYQCCLRANSEWQHASATDDDVLRFCAGRQCGGKEQNGQVCDQPPEGVFLCGYGEALECWWHVSPRITRHARGLQGGAPLASDSGPSGLCCGRLQEDHPGTWGPRPATVCFCAQLSSSPLFGPRPAFYMPVSYTEGLNVLLKVFIMYNFSHPLKMFIKSLIFISTDIKNDYNL